MKHSAPPPQVQVPAVQASAVSDEHELPHDPQCELLVCVFTQSPLQHSSLPPVQTRPHAPQFVMLVSD